jgi:hypothetical protein
MPIAPMSSQRSIVSRLVSRADAPSRLRFIRSFAKRWPRDKHRARHDAERRHVIRWRCFRCRFGRFRLALFSALISSPLAKETTLSLAGDRLSLMPTDSRQTLFGLLRYQSTTTPHRHRLPRSIQLLKSRCPRWLILGIQASA